MQSRIISPLEEEGEANKAAEQIRNTSPMLVDIMPSSQEENTQQLNNFETRMDQAFNILTDISGKFSHLTSNQSPYINTDRAKEFNNGTTNPQNPQ